MQINGQEQQEPQHDSRKAADSVLIPNPPAEQTDRATHQEGGGQTLQEEPGLQSYLQSICALMPNDVPAVALQEMRKEMYDHLQNTVTSFEELGSTHDTAVHQALVQFGAPEFVARQWRQEWEKTLALTPGRLGPSLKFALKVWGGSDIATLALCLLLPVLTYTKIETPLRSLLILTMFFVPPLFCGILIGLRARRNPVLCTLLGRLLMLPVIVIGFVGINFWSQYYAYLVTGKQSLPALQAHMETGVQGALSFIPLWFLLSLLSSGVVAIGRRLSARPRHRVAR